MKEFKIILSEEEIEILKGRDIVSKDVLDSPYYEIMRKSYIGGMLFGAFERSNKDIEI